MDSNAPLWHTHGPISLLAHSRACADCWRSSGGRDTAARAAGRKELNFPDAARGEAQAVYGKRERAPHGSVLPTRQSPKKLGSRGGTPAAAAAPQQQPEVLGKGAAGLPYFKGVCPIRNGWRATHYSGGDQYYLGTFATREAAALDWCSPPRSALLPPHHTARAAASLRAQEVTRGGEQLSSFCFFCECEGTRRSARLAGSS